MKILLANPRGFCAGVNMAIECLDEAIRRVGPGIYVYHEIVHNKYVVDRFTAQGVTFVDTMEEVPEGSILLFSGHGVSPEIRQIARDRSLQTVDATCPLVTKVHLEAIRYANAGFHIILIGHEGHDEVIGTLERLVIIEGMMKQSHLRRLRDSKATHDVEGARVLRRGQKSRPLEIFVSLATMPAPDESP